MAVVALGGFYFAGFSWPVFAAMGLTTAVIFTAGWFLGGRLARFLRNLKAEFSQIAERDTEPDGLSAPPLEDFRKLSEAWRETRERITRIFSSQKDFTVNAAHELKTPLAALRVTGETALRGTAHEDELRETIGAMLEETLRVSDVVEKLLMLARAESGRLPVEANYHKADAVVGEVVDLLRPLAEVKGQVVAPSIPEGLTLWADANLLRLVLGNLVSNAIRYSPEGSLIVLRAAATAPGAIAIEVLDEGAGILPEEEPRLFERFFRGKSTTAHGSGLGLPIARWAAECFGGRIEFERRLERGSVFRVLCPETEWDDLAKTKKEGAQHPSWQVDMLWAARAEPSQLLSRLGTSRAGLSPEEAQKRRTATGKNILRDSTTPNVGPHLWLSLRTPFNAILAASALLSIALHQPNSAIVISAMIVISTALRFVQERRSFLAAESLQRMVRTKSDVLRPGASGKHIVPIEDLVPGDCLHLSSGDMVPADLRLLSASGLQISETTFTGESFPVHKEARTNDEDSEESPSLCYMGTHVVQGTGIGVVITTGHRTRLGGISDKLRRDRPKTVFDRGVEKVSWMLLGFIAVLGPLVFFINGALKGDWTSALLFALAVIVGLTPGLLPVIVNINLARAALALSRSGLIIKELSAIHSLGAIDILCTDKTGTLTMDTPEFMRAAAPLRGDCSEAFNHAYFNALFQGSLRSTLDQELLRHADLADLRAEAKNMRLLGEIPFDYERRRVSVILHRAEATNALLVSKGAPEAVLDVCTHYTSDQGNIALDESSRRDIWRHLISLQHGGTRVLGVASKDIPVAARSLAPEAEAAMTFLGFVIFRDPLKLDSRETIARLREAGATVKILTGDHPESAEEAARNAGLETRRVLTGEQIAAMNDETLRLAATEATVFARLSPLQKARIVGALRAEGHCVGFLGDGANDANALREADVGIVTDTSADLARESAQIIMVKKNLETLLAGIDQGRTASGNILKYIKITFSSNFGNVFSVLVASVVLPFLPMRAIQLLVQNLLYDIAQVFLPWDRVDERFRAHPQPWSAESIARFMLVFGPVSSVFDLLTFAVLWFGFGANSPANQRLFQTGWFTVGLATQLLIVHVMRTEKVPLLQSRATTPVVIGTLFMLIIGLALPWVPLGQVLGFVHLPATYSLWVVFVVAAYLLTVQGVKYLYRQRIGGWL